MKRLIIVLAAAALAIAGGSARAEPWGLQEPDSRGVLPGGLQVGADFNGDGYGDLAIGVPLEGVSSTYDAGAVNVLHGSSAGLSATDTPDQVWTQNTASVEEIAEDADVLGSAVAVGDFNGDGYTDLAAGAPGESVGSVLLAGGLNVVYGSASGLSATIIADQLWTQNTSNVNGTAQEGDAFGASLAAGDFNGDGRSDLAIGVPEEEVGSITDGGGVNVLYGSSSGLSATAVPDQLWTQDTANVNGVAEDRDSFGSALAAGDFNADGRLDLIIGIEDEDLGAGTEGGAAVLYGSSSGLSATAIPDQFWYQDSPNVEGTAEPGDFFGAAVSAGDYNGDGRDDAAIGVIHEQLGAQDQGGGAVNVLYGSPSGLSATAVPDQLWSQDSSNVEDTTEWTDVFGSALSSGDFNFDGRDDLAIGVRGEDVPGFSDAGAVNVLYGSSSGLSATAVADQFWHQDSPEVKDSADHNEDFGNALAAGDFNGDGRADLAIGVPLERVGTMNYAGGVNLLHGASAGLSASSPEDQFWTQDSSYVEGVSEASDWFGKALPGSGRCDICTASDLRD